MAGYIGNEPLNEATQTRESFTATSGQTSFATSGYTPGYLDVYFNGVHLETTDYTATNGTDVVLDTAAAADDILTIVAWKVFNPTQVNVSDITDLTATAAEINTLDGITATTTELNYTDGVTSNIQTQLDAKQPLDSVLTNTTASYTTAEETKLAGIEAGADVTDTANVTAAGALMDSEVTNLAQVKAFSSADYATAAQGALADSALQANQTITLSGDVSGSGTTAITVTVADDSHNHVISNVDGLQTALDAKAPLASPTLTGTPLAPTATAGTNTTQIATTAFVGTAVSNLVDAAPAALDTLNELAAALGDDANFSTTVTNSIATKVAKSGDTMTGALNFGDNVKAQFGAGNDLQIYHDGSGSRIYENGTGILAFYSNGSGINFYKGEAAGNMLTLATDGAVTAYYNNAEKLATTSTGAEVTGTLNATTDLQINGSSVQTSLDAKASTGKAIAMAIVFGG